MTNPTSWAKKHCPHKKFASLKICEELKCPHVEYRDGKAYGCKKWMEYTNQTGE